MGAADQWQNSLPPAPAFTAGVPLPFTPCIGSVSLLRHLSALIAPRLCRKGRISGLHASQLPQPRSKHGSAVLHARVSASKTLRRRSTGCGARGSLQRRWAARSSPPAPVSAAAAAHSRPHNPAPAAPRSFSVYKPPEEWRLNREQAWANGPAWSVSGARAAHRRVTPGAALPAPAPPRPPPLSLLFCLETPALAAQPAPTATITLTGLYPGAL